MSRIPERLAETDRRIRDCTVRIELYRNRIARRAYNPALAEQAEGLLPPMLAQRKELVRFRRNLVTAIELQAALAPETATAQRLLPRLPRYIR